MVLCKTEHCRESSDKQRSCIQDKFSRWSTYEPLTTRSAQTHTLRPATANEHLATNRRSRHPGAENCREFAKNKKEHSSFIGAHQRRWACNRRGMGTRSVPGVSAYVANQGYQRFRRHTRVLTMSS